MQIFLRRLQARILKDSPSPLHILPGRILLMQGKQHINKGADIPLATDTVDRGLLMVQPYQQTGPLLAEFPTAIRKNALQVRYHPRNEVVKKCLLEERHLLRSNL
jgi:hypothetical protein